MDIFLERNCSHIIKRIKECGYPFENVIREPLYCLFGCSSDGVEIFAEQYGKEIDAAIEFADEYDIDVSELGLSTPEKKASFAIMYIATELQTDYSTFICIKED